MNMTEFLRPALVGERFAGHAIPLEFLKDLSVLEEMLVEVAKWEFLKEHLDRKRSPRGFTDGMELRLTAIEQGSAIPVISLCLDSNVLVPPAGQAYFERARDDFVRAIRAAEDNQAITDHLPDHALSYFDKIGRSLRDDEAIEFTHQESNAPARLTKVSRRKLLMASSSMKEFTDEISERGAIPEADQDNLSFQIQLLDGHKIKAPISAPHLNAILEAFAGYQTGIRVLVQGIGRLNRSEKLIGFDAVEHLTLLDPLDVPARLDEFRLLKDGWHEGRGYAPEGCGLDWLSGEFSRHYPEDLSNPYAYPTPDGGVQLEWERPDFEASLEIDLQSRLGHWHELNLDTEQDSERELNLADPADWQWLSNRVTEFDSSRTA